MARPMLLMKEDLLKVMYEKRKLGVPLTKLIEQHKLSITHPTLARMLMHYSVLSSPSISEKTKVVVRASLFPEWLSGKELVMSQPVEWYYTGVFPLGEWKKR